jgi:putative cell wall binding repeat protein
MITPANPVRRSGRAYGSRRRRKRSAGGILRLDGADADIVAGVPRLVLKSALPLLIAALTAAGCGLRDEPGTANVEVAAQADEDVPAGLGSPATATKDTVRIPGADAAENAAGAASAVFPATGEASRPAAVTLVDEEDWQGAVAASVFAGNRTMAPILLTEGDNMPAITEATLKRLNPTGVDLLDGARLIRIGDVASPTGYASRNVTGADPYTRAAAIDRLATTVLGRPAGHVIVASGEQVTWAIPAAPWAARSGHPILFAQAETLPPATLAALKRHDKPRVYVLGPKTVIGQAVVKRLKGLASDVTRIEGANQVENAIAFARYGRGTFGWGYVTPGHNFTLASARRPMDAAAAATLGSNGVFAPLLLTDSAGALPKPVDGYLLDVQPGYSGDPASGVFNRVFLLGDETAVSAAAQGRLDEITELVPINVPGG